jgi:serine/threonine protein kinase
MGNLSLPLSLYRFAQGIDACFTPSSNRLFAEYMIGPIIGKGGFSVVRAARCKKSGQEMAVKVLVPPPSVLSSTLS